MLLYAKRLIDDTPQKNKWLDSGAITCAIICILFHPLSISFWGIVELITTFIAIYGREDQ
jgi:hypothetical protein